jgi:single-strand DNA-binding protein
MWLRTTAAELFSHSGASFFNNFNHTNKKENQMNQCFLSGNLGQDPEIRFTSEGSQIATFNLAFHSYKEKTNWVKIVCFNKLAEVAERYLHKGARIAVAATFDQNRWETEDGIVRSSYSLIANSIEFIKTDGRGFEDDGEDGDGEEETPAQNADNDIPF